MYENAKGVSIVYISEEMFGLMSAIMSQAGETGTADMIVGNVEDENVDISKIFGFMDKLRGMYIMQTDDPEEAYSIHRNVQQIIDGKENEYRELMKVSDGGDRIAFYYITPDKKYVEEFLMLQVEADDSQQSISSCSVIQFIAEGLTIQDIRRRDDQGQRVAGSRKTEGVGNFRYICSIKTICYEENNDYQRADLCGCIHIDNFM